MFIHKSMQEIIDSVARYGPGVGLGMGTIGSAGIHVRPGYSSVFANRKSQIIHSLLARYRVYANRMQAKKVLRF